MRGVVFLRSQIPSADSRLQRYVDIIKEKKIPYLITAWNRENKKKNEKENTILYNKRAPIGGGVSNIFSLILWNLFLFRILWENRKNYIIIHSIDFDTCIPAYIIAKIFKKKFIFDVYDKYTDARNTPSFVAFFIDRIEKYCCIHCDKLILPDECRIKQLNISPNKERISIIENVPYTQFNLVTKEIRKDNLVFSYVGILEEKNRGIENLLNAVAHNPSVKLYIAGAGKIESLVKEKTEKYPNIVFYGQVSSQKALEILSKSDVIVGMYYKTIKNHLYASPNKYFEHLFLGKVLLTTEGTPPGDKVKKYNTGFAIGETEADILHFIKNIDINIIKQYSINARKIWIEKYNNYQEKLKEKYLNLLKS
jgi:wfbS